MTRSATRPAPTAYNVALVLRLGASFFGDPLNIFAIEVPGLLLQRRLARSRCQLTTGNHAVQRRAPHTHDFQGFGCRNQFAVPFIAHSSIHRFTCGTRDTRGTRYTQYTPSG